MILIKQPFKQTFKQPFKQTFKQPFKLYNPSLFTISFQDRMRLKTQQKQQDEFKQEILSIANKPTYSLIDYKQRVASTINKQTKGIRAMFQNTDTETKREMLQQQRILDAFYDHELSQDKLELDSKQEIAAIVQCDLQEINRLFKSYQYHKGVHGFLRYLKEIGEPVPETQDDFENAMYNHPESKKFFMTKKQRQPKFSNKQRKQRMKWGLSRKMFDQDL